MISEYFREQIDEQFSGEFKHEKPLEPVDIKSYTLEQINTMFNVPKEQQTPPF